MKGKEEDISITVNIAGVAYPLRIQSSEEEYIRKAEHLINERLRALKDDYKITDRPTLFSMLSIQLASELVQQKELNVGTDSGISEQFRQLNNVLDSALNEI